MGAEEENMITFRGHKTVMALKYNKKRLGPVSGGKVGGNGH